MTLLRRTDSLWAALDVHHARRFLWTDFDSSGKEVPMLSIEAFFAETHMTGLRFVYGSDTEKTHRLVRR